MNVQETVDTVNRATDFGLAVAAYPAWARGRVASEVLSNVLYGEYSKMSSEQRARAVAATGILTRFGSPLLADVTGRAGQDGVEICYSAVAGLAGMALGRVMPEGVARVVDVVGTAVEAATAFATQGPLALAPAAIGFVKLVTAVFDKPPDKTYVDEVLAALPPGEVNPIKELSVSPNRLITAQGLVTARIIAGLRQPDEVWIPFDPVTDTEREAILLAVLPEERAFTAALIDKFNGDGKVLGLNFNDWVAIGCSGPGARLLGSNQTNFYLPRALGRGLVITAPLRFPAYAVLQYGDVGGYSRHHPISNGARYRIYSRERSAPAASAFWRTCATQVGLVGRGLVES